MVDLAHILSDSDGETESPSPRSVGEGCTFNATQGSQAKCMHVAQVPVTHEPSCMTQNPANFEESLPYHINPVVDDPAPEPPASGTDEISAYSPQQMDELAHQVRTLPTDSAGAEQPPRVLVGGAYTQSCDAVEAPRSSQAEDRCFPSPSSTNKIVPESASPMDHATPLLDPDSGTSISSVPVDSIPPGDVMVSSVEESTAQTTMYGMDGTHDFRDCGRESTSLASQSVAISPREATEDSSEESPVLPGAYTHPLLEHPPQRSFPEVDRDREGTHALAANESRLSREDPEDDVSLLDSGPPKGVQSTAAVDLDNATLDEAAIPATADLLLLDDALPELLVTPLMPVVSSNMVDLLGFLADDTVASKDAPATEGFGMTCSAAVVSASDVSLHPSCSADDVAILAPPLSPLASTIDASLVTTPALCHADSCSSKLSDDLSFLDHIPGPQVCQPTLAEPASAPADPLAPRSPSPDLSLNATYTDASLSGLDSTDSNAVIDSEPKPEEPPRLSVPDLPTHLLEDVLVLPTIVISPPDEDLDSHTHLTPDGDCSRNSTDMQDEEVVRFGSEPLEDVIDFHPRVQELVSSLGSPIEHIPIESSAQETTPPDGSQAEPLVSVDMVETEDMPSEDMQHPSSPGLPPSSPPCSQVSDLVLPSSQDDGFDNTSKQHIVDADFIPIQDDSEADMELCNSQPSSSPPDQAFSSSPPLALSSPPTSPQLLPEDKGKARADVAEFDLEEARPQVEAGHEPRKRPATDELEAESSNAKRARTTSYSPPPPPNPKRRTMLGQKRAYKKLVQPFRSPLVNIEDVLAGKDHVYATGRSSPPTKPAVKEEPEDAAAVTRSRDDCETAGDALDEPKKLVATRDRTANAGKPFKALVIQPGTAASTLATKTGSTLQALQARAQKLKQAVKIRDERERARDGESLEALVRKWRTVGRDVAWLVWDTVKDLDPGDSLKIVPAKGGWDEDEVGPPKKGREGFASGGFKEGWGWDDGKAASVKQGGFDCSWGWDDKKEGEYEGQGDGRLEERMDVDEEEPPKMNHSLGTMLRHLGIDPETLGWDEDEGDFVGEP